MRIMALTLPAAQEARRRGPARHSTMVKLDINTRSVFAAATRLDPDEVESLCLNSFASRFPIPRESTTVKRNYIQKRRNWWLFTGPTRYCPTCLAGDGSAIQQAHGGAWRRSWRLPITFACLRHRQMLRYRCTSCDRPAHGHTMIGARGPLVAGPLIGGIHPAQCRWSQTDKANSATPDCGARLDSADPHTDISDTAFALQQRLLDALTHGTPVTIAGVDAEPSQYFTDLRLLSQLVNSVWSRARPVAPTAATEFIYAVDAQQALHTAGRDLGELDLH
jgi:hypothetical protein